MADEEESETDEPKKASRKPLVVGLALALLLGGGAFYAVWSGLILGPKPPESMPGDIPASDTNSLADTAFVPIQPLVVNVGTGNQKRHLRFQAQLEVRSQDQENITRLLPRVVDVLNGYLRAVDASELEQRTALIRLRAQMLRRIQVVTGEGQVRDLLIMEFVLN